MHEDEKQALIELCKQLIADANRDDAYRTEPEYFKMAKIALASLTADPDCYSVGNWHFSGNDAKKQAEGYCKTSAPQKQPIAHYTVPPVSEVKPFVVKLLPSINPAMFNADVIFGYRKARAEDIQSIKAAGGSVEDD